MMSAQPGTDSSVVGHAVEQLQHQGFCYIPNLLYQLQCCVFFWALISFALEFCTLLTAAESRKVVFTGAGRELTRCLWARPCWRCTPSNKRNSQTRCTVLGRSTRHCLAS